MHCSREAYVKGKGTANDMSQIVSTGASRHRVDVGYDLATWSVACASSIDAGGTMHSKACPVLLVILICLFFSEHSLMLGM